MIRKILSHSLKIGKPYCNQLYSFSTNSKKLQEILRNIKIQTENNKQANLIDAGVISGSHIDPQTKKVSLVVNLTKDYRKIKAILKQHLQLAGFSSVQISLAPKQQKDKYVRKGNLLGIKKIIAVSSCKGGVGKSTIAVNVAATLKNMGYKVGIFDSDIYGPSLPTLINKEKQILTPRQENSKQIQPIIYEDMKCMSFGFAGSKPAIMRGPMVSAVVSQLLHQTYWEELDYLIVDMPPGTGDIQLSLCQQLKFDGAIIVTTPQRLAFMDVIKGIQMFQDLNVPILGIAQNMAYYECSKCGSKDQIFGRGYTKMMMEQFGIQNSIRFPLMAQISKYSDLGSPLAFVLPQSHALIKLYSSLVQNMKKQLEKPVDKVYAYYNTAQRTIIIEANGVKKKISPLYLRQHCRCAGCIDQLSGAMILKKQQIDPQVFPSKIQEKGNYAVAVVWSDGHRSSIYPYKRLLSNDIPAL